MENGMNMKVMISIDKIFDYDYIDCSFCYMLKEGCVCRENQWLAEDYDASKEKFTLVEAVFKNISNEIISIDDSKIKAIDDDLMTYQNIEMRCRKMKNKHQCVNETGIELMPGTKVRLLLCFHCSSLNEIVYIDYNCKSRTKIGEEVCERTILSEHIERLENEKAELIEKMEGIKKELNDIKYNRNEPPKDDSEILEELKCKYRIIEDDDYCRIISMEKDCTVSYHREFDKSKGNHGWVDKGSALISLKEDNMFGFKLDNRTIIKSPAFGIFESDNNKMISYNEEICRIRKYDKSEKQMVIDEIEKQEVKDKVYEKERKKMLEREVLDELIEEGKVFNIYTKRDGNRTAIPSDVANAVWNRDGGKCCICGSKENLEFDHIIPISKGGATTFRNLQILCKNCNIRKSDKI